MSLPLAFCWTRVGTEAGQSLDSILRRKESERLSNNGLFFWGVGNAIGPSLRELVRSCADPEVVFTPIKSRPRRQDSDPEQVAVWTKAQGLDGRTFDLPARTLITSRFESASVKTAHYALVCFSETPLTSLAPDPSTLANGEVANLLTGRPVGASQVTAVVRRQERTGSQSGYRVLLRAQLAAPYFLRLSEPVRLTKEEQAHSWESSVTARWLGVTNSPATGTF